MTDAEEITRLSKSNLALAFFTLGQQRRKDMTVFYAFCRLIDDIVDDNKSSKDQKEIALNGWRSCIEEKNPKNTLEKQLIDIIDRYQINPEYLLELIEGCSSDIEDGRRFESWEDLKQYTYKVACCVGLASLKVFGCSAPKSKEYAVALGHALQITNILRDIHEDYRDYQRVYLPIQILEKYGYKEDSLKMGVTNDSFVKVAEELAELAENYYEKAVSFLTPEDKRRLNSAEGMRLIYHELLKKMRRDGFKVFEKRYTVPKWKKIYYALKPLFTK